MSQEVTTRSTSAVAALQGLRTGLANVVSTIPTTSADPFMRLLKSGTWVYGPEDIEVQPGSLWAINPLSICHGYVCWTNHDPKEKKKNEKVGEVMVPLHKPKPDHAALPDHGWDWRDQLSLQVRCLTGEDEGQQTRYNVSSVGGQNAVSELIQAILTQIDAGKEEVVPVITFEVDSYKHRQWGLTYIPKLVIKRWVKLTDVTLVSDLPDEKDEPEPQSQPAAQAAPARRMPVDSGAGPAIDVKSPGPTRRAPVAAQETVGTGFAAETAAAADGEADNDAAFAAVETPKPATTPAAGAQVRTRRRPLA